MDLSNQPKTKEPNQRCKTPLVPISLFDTGSLAKKIFQRQSCPFTPYFQIEKTINSAKSIDLTIFPALFRRTSPLDIVLLDHDMPRMTGAGAAREILEQRPNQRLIFLSAYGNNIMSKLNDVQGRHHTNSPKAVFLEFSNQKN